MLGLTNTYKNITNVSELINDAHYILDDIVSDGVYAVDANGKLIDYNTADATALGVALVAGEHKFMIAKKNAAGTTLYWTKSYSDLSLTNYSEVDGTNNKGYLSGISIPQLNKDFTTWKAGALSDFKGKANTAAIAAASNAGDMCTELNTFNASDSFKDWYVPACGQLALMYINMTEINEALTKISGTALDASYYWSSSEYSSSYAWGVSFGNGHVSSTGKSNIYRVRFIRDISVSKPLKERVSDLEQSIPTKVSQLENDSNYVQDDVVNHGVYIVDLEGKLHTTANWTGGSNATGVALINDNVSIIIAPKNWYTTDGSDYDGAWNGNTKSTWDAAVEYCSAYSNGCKGVNQWYLPKTVEYIQIVSNRAAVEKALTAISGELFSSPGYEWTSIQNGSSYAWSLDFDQGQSVLQNKTESNGVRPVCAFEVSKPLKERVSDLESSIPTKVSQLENDKNYIENGDGYESGVYIAVQSGKLINPDEYDSTTETAVGVAVIDPKASFIIGLNHTTKIPWGTSAQGFYIDISGLTNYSSAETAATDMDGIANTDVITSIYSGTDCAAGLAKSQTITYGSDSLTGYLGSAGEWLVVLNNYEAVKSATAIAGGTAFQITSSYYWTSTEHSSSNAWGASSTGVFDYYEKYYSLSNNGVVPFYKINNETTVLSKINLISTPVGSATAPIYIDSNGNITSTTYGGGTKVTLNGSGKGGSIASFYAPTSAGTSGYILTSNGSGAPSWLSPGKKIASTSGSDVVSLSKTMHAVITDFTSGKLYYAQSTTQLEEYSFEFVCPENFPGITIYPSTSWINIPETFTAGKTYIGSILGNTGIILECETALDYGDSSSVSWSMSASLPVISGNAVEQSITIYLNNRIMTQTDTTIENCVKIYNSFFGSARYYTPSSNKGIIDKFSTTVTLRRTFNGIISTLQLDPSKYTTSSYTIGSTLVTFLLNTPLSLTKTKSGGNSYTFYVGTLRYSS